MSSEYIISEGDHRGMNEQIFPQTQLGFFYVKPLLENSQCFQMSSENLVLQLWIVPANLGIQGYSS